MNTVKTWQIVSTSSSDTERIAENLGSHLKGGEVLELVSDLGGGKTAFVRGLARGLGSPDHVSSPTFKICNVYQTTPKNGGLELHHFDFYRLAEAGIIADELAEVIGQPNVVVAIEWGEVVQDVLPKRRLTVKLLPSSDTSRQVQISYADSLEYLMEGLPR